MAYGLAFSPVVLQAGQGRKHGIVFNPVQDIEIQVNGRSLIQEIPLA